MSCLHVRNCQIICPIMMQITFHYCFTFFLFLISKGYVSKISTKLYISIFLMFNILLGVLVWRCSCFMILSDDVEVNPGHINSISECLSICHWNLNSISAHDYSKLFLLKAYISVRKFDTICLSETYLDSTYLHSPWWWQFSNFRV